MCRYNRNIVSYNVKVIFTNRDTIFESVYKKGRIEIGAHLSFGFRGERIENLIRRFSEVNKVEEGYRLTPTVCTW